MAKRPNLRARVEAAPRGREAVFGGRPTVDPQPATVDRPPTTSDRGPSTVDAPSWEESHTRVTFYCPRDLLAAVEAEMQRSGRSKSRVIVDALAAHLGRA